MSFLNDKRKYLFVVAILILAGFCCFFNYAFGAFEDAIVREKVWEKQQDLGLLCGIVDKMVEMDIQAGKSSGYEEVLTFAVQDIETNYYLTYAQVFDENLHPLTPLHPGVGGGQKHNPVDYPEFVEAVMTNEYGNLVYWYETEEGGGRDVFMTFRWVPTDTGHSARHLVAVGISKHTISEQIDKTVEYGFIALIAVAAVYILGCTALVTKYGQIYARREKSVVSDGRRP
jgi:hypothetical protein